MARLATKTTVSKLIPVAHGDAKFRTLKMCPFFAEYLPTDLPNLEDKELLQAKEAGTTEGDAYLAKFI